MRRTPPPLWFSICVAVALAWLCRYSLAGSADAALAGGHQPHVQQAFWPIVFAIVSAIWRGLEVAGRVTLAAVAYSVKLLWLFASKAANGVIAVGNALLKGLRVAWQFFELSYEKVIKPAFTKFWRWFDKFRKWLDDTFGPDLKYLRRAAPAPTQLLEVVDPPVARFYRRHAARAARALIARLGMGRGARPAPGGSRGTDRAALPAAASEAQ
jgi:hypothetical protein